MTIDEAIEIYGQQAIITDLAIEAGVRKIDMVILFDLLDKLNIDLYDKKLILKVEETLAIIAEQSFDENLNSVLHEIKNTIKQIKAKV